MTIYLHCGGHKTASSFMKMFLRKNKALFEAQRIAIHLDEFRDREVTPEDIIKLAEQDYQNDYQQIIISEDANIIGLMPGIFQPGDRGFFNTNSILKFSNLIARVNQKYSTKFLLCVRRQDSYLESCYKFRKTHGAKYSWEYFLDKVQKTNISWYDVVNAVAGYIGKENCMITPYELLKKSQQEFITTFFRSIISIDSERVIIPPPNNQGASELIIETIDYFDRNFSEIPAKHRKEILSIIKKYQVKSASKTSLLSEKSKDEILKKYADSNQKLFSNYIFYLPTNYYGVANSQNNSVSGDRQLATSY
ncbi:hypothetical protein I4641_09665 [Waterburya agarophytonicola K14]|uniref:Uncharacterized protein n=1 Tax=Waterburya agarophytonicola KI4 TaxID=2874699 RepID=A0A964BPK3_9CYAN|nr:hypothetical protein [Waterburya agarophytonicola]MCC0177243.1 hypothetical protein [Waterburya agarophytonicola KI4]